MKKAILIACSLLSLNLCFTSCSSEYDANPAVDNSKVRNPLQGDFTALVNGVRFIADEKTFTDTTIDDVRSISITGLAYNSDMDPQKYQTITLYIPNYTGTISYPFDGSASAVYVIKDSAQVQTFSSVKDTLSVINMTQAGDVLEGTFHFSVVRTGGTNNETVIIGDGSFSIPK